MASKQYHEYIRSDAWAQIRVDLFQIRGKRCERCGKGSKLHIHHKTYKNFGNEEPEDLEILCEACHKDEHRKTEKKKEAREKWKKRMRQRQANKQKKKQTGIEGKFIKVKGVLCYRKKQY